MTVAEELTLLSGEWQSEAFYETFESSNNNSLKVLFQVKKIECCQCCINQRKIIEPELRRPSLISDVSHLKHLGWLSLV